MRQAAERLHAGSHADRRAEDGGDQPWRSPWRTLRKMNAVAKATTTRKEQKNRSAMIGATEEAMCMAASRSSQVGARILLRQATRAVKRGRGDRMTRYAE